MLGKGLAKRARWRIAAYIRAMHLEVVLAANPHKTMRVAVQEGQSLDEQLEEFLSQKGRYANGWVPLGEGTSDVFVRYDQIIEVRKNLSP
jgi:hypothetical protein